MPILRLWICCALLPCAHAQSQPAAAPSDFSQPAPLDTVPTDGALVIDTKARLAWSRCVEGMVWTGRTCAFGIPHLMTHSQAQALSGTLERRKRAGAATGTRVSKRLVWIKASL